MKSEKKIVELSKLFLTLVLFLNVYSCSCSCWCRCLCLQVFRHQFRGIFFWCSLSWKSWLNSIYYNFFRSCCSHCSLWWLVVFRSINWIVAQWDPALFMLTAYYTLKSQSHIPISKFIWMVKHISQDFRGIIWCARVLDGHSPSTEFTLIQFAFEFFLLIENKRSTGMNLVCTKAHSYK